MRKLTYTLLSAAVLTGYCACRNATTGCDLGFDPADTVWNQPFIPADSANKMILSYLTSIRYQSADSDVRSFIVDANALRRYLSAGKGLDISKLKIMLAHNSNYIQSGNFGKNCGYSNKALTVMLAGYDTAGNYVYTPGNKVLDFSMPCPQNCSNVGSAASDLLVNHP